jgi:copper chaperone CopZ
MRTLILSCFILAACQHADSAERSAQVVESKPKPAPAAPVALALTASTHSCGGGATCGGQCGGQCGGAGEAVKWASVPADARWTKLQVTGMHCGGCARRIERALAKVDGVLGVDIDYTTGSVRVAVADTVDARGLAKPTIESLGYQVH